MWANRFNILEGTHLYFGHSLITFKKTVLTASLQQEEHRTTAQALFIPGQHELVALVRCLAKETDPAWTRHHFKT
jgi:hypothetical protein